MCGGFVMAYSSAKIDASTTSSGQFFYHLIYNMGRITAYSVFGVMFGYVGSIFFLFPLLVPYIYVIIGLVMILMGFSLMGKIKFLTSLESSIAFNPSIKKIFSKLIHAKSISSFYGLGILNGFLPCGLVYFFLTFAFIAHTPLWGGLTMVIFGISTMPSLLGFGFFVGFLGQSGFREMMIKIASLVIIGYGLYIAYMGIV